MWFRFATVPVLTAFVVYRVVRYLLVDDAVGSAAVSLTVDFLFGSVVNWLLVGLVLVAIVHDVDSPLTVSLWSKVALAGIAVWHARIWYRVYGPTGLGHTTVESLAVTLFGVTLLAAATFLLLTGDLRDSAVLTVTSFVLGYFVGILTTVSPFLELFLGGTLLFTGVQAVRHRRRGGLAGIDLEELVGSTAVRVMQTEKGIYALLISLTGLLSALIPLVTLVLMYHLDLQGEAPPEGWSVMVLPGALFTIYSAYGIWYWTTILRRLPAYLETHRGGFPSTRTPARPCSLFLPGSLSLAGGGLLVAYPSYALLGLIAILAGVAWMGYSVHRTRRTPPQDVSNDGLVIVLGFIVQHVPIILFTSVVVYSLVLLPVLFVLPDIRERFSSQVAGVVVLTCAGTFVGLFAVLTDLSPEVGPLLSMFALPALLGLVVAFAYQFSVNRSE